ncbi:MAG: Hsp20/alpha crystallin family protein [Bacteroidia bacterium]
MTLIKVNNQKPLVDKNNFGFSPLFDEVFDNFLGGSVFNKPAMNRVPAVNINESDKAYEIEFAAPGYEKDEFKINLSQNILTVSAEKKNQKEDKQEGYTRREFNFSSFKRSFTLPDSAKEDEIRAEYKNGILHVSIPKEDNGKSKSREIAIE